MNFRRSDNARLFYRAIHIRRRKIFFCLRLYEYSVRNMKAFRPLPAETPALGRPVISNEAMPLLPGSYSEHAAWERMTVCGGQTPASRAGCNVMKGTEPFSCVAVIRDVWRGAEEKRSHLFPFRSVPNNRRRGKKDLPPASSAFSRCGKVPAQGTKAGIFLTAIPRINAA